MSLYGNSKLCNIITADKFAKILSGSGVTCNAVHPGLCSTPIFHIWRKNLFLRMVLWILSKVSKKILVVASYCSYRLLLIFYSYIYSHQEKELRQLYMQQCLTQEENLQEASWATANLLENQRRRMTRNFVILYGKLVNKCVK